MAERSQPQVRDGSALELLRPGERGYDHARRVWNAMVTTVPP